MYKTLLVVDTPDITIENENVTVLTFEDYVQQYPKLNEPKVRLINLCNTERYLSRGYYCSLLAEARQHKVLPNVSTINDLRTKSDSLSNGVMLRIPPDLMLTVLPGRKIEFTLFFGWVEQEEWKKLGKLIFEEYSVPCLKVTLLSKYNGPIIKVKSLSLEKLTKKQKDTFIKRLTHFTQTVWRHPVSKKRHRWDMAILINPLETHPPSNKLALSHFVKAAAKIGIHAELITAQQAKPISQYDALFIRETTAIDHYTYHLARKAEQEGLIVIDDSTSILRCCNKVFLHDAFSYSHVPSLKTIVVHDSTPPSIAYVEQTFNYPVVLKMPEGSFSKGVFKINNRDELIKTLNELLIKSALVLVQEFIYTDYDWRIGVLNGRAIYACRYYMAPNHWQIYNHSKKRDSSGAFETLPTFEVPKLVLDAALKACSIIGKGLYGVDIKQKGNQVYVIEVNDNPNIDHHIETQYLGNELYMIIMTEFANRLEKRGR